MLFSRWKDIFSANFWKKAEGYSMESTWGFFLFWNFLFVILSISLLTFTLFWSGDYLANLADEYVNDFKIELTSDELNVEGLPDPFVLTEFLNDDVATLGVIKNEEFERGMLNEFKRDFEQEIVGEKIVFEDIEFELEDAEFVLDTNRELYPSINDIDRTRNGFYFFKDSFVVVDTSENSEIPFVEVSYKDAEFGEFVLDKKFFFDKWNEVDGVFYFFMLVVLFIVLVVSLLIVRAITSFWWALILLFVALVFGKKITYSNAYLVVLNYMVPITLFELFLFWTGMPFTTLILVIVFGVLHVRSNEVESV